MSRNISTTKILMITHCCILMGDVVSLKQRDKRCFYLSQIKKNVQSFHKRMYLKPYNTWHPMKTLVTREVPACTSPFSTNHNYLIPAIQGLPIDMPRTNNSRQSLGSVSIYRVVLNAYKNCAHRTKYFFPDSLK